MTLNRGQRRGSGARVAAERGTDGSGGRRRGSGFGRRAAATAGLVLNLALLAAVRIVQSNVLHGTDWRSAGISTQLAAPLVVGLELGFWLLLGAAVAQVVVLLSASLRTKGTPRDI